MTITKDRDWLAELQRTVEREAKKRPPAPVIEGPGYVMLDPAVAIRSQLARRRQLQNALIDCAGIAAGVTVGLAVSTVVTLVLVNL